MSGDGSDETWERYFDEVEQCYYFLSTKTNESRWAMPQNPDWMAVRDDITDDTLHYLHYKTKEISTEAPPAKEDDVAGTGAATVWEELTDPESGCTYYYSNTTNTSQWEQPMWMDALHEETGFLYYYNSVTGESSWERPPDFTETAEEDVAGASAGEGGDMASTVPRSPPRPLGKRARTPPPMAKETSLDVEEEGLEIAEVPASSPKSSDGGVKQSISKRPRYPKGQGDAPPAPPAAPVSDFGPPRPPSDLMEEAMEPERSPRPAAPPVPPEMSATARPLQPPSDRPPPRLLPQDALEALADLQWYKVKSSVRICLLRDLFSSRAEPSRVHAEKVFRRLDKKRKGYLTVQDLSRALTRHDLDKDKIRIVLEHFDCEDDMMVPQDKWCAFICEAPKPDSDAMDVATG
mmetsp:Transcript_3212/g.9242  ORF Transcript_3212/g.9242 Transcript_3212/m.9242 type:complete len:406 (+) Transcript_3212:469-1686(+)